MSGRGSTWSSRPNICHGARLPPSWYVDDLMRHEGRPYYVGLLRAAELHGASHQAVMEFQVVTNKKMPELHVAAVGFDVQRDGAFQTEQFFGDLSSASACIMKQFRQQSGHLASPELAKRGRGGGIRCLADGIEQGEIVLIERSVA